MPVYGGVSGQGRGADVDGGEVEQTHSHLHSVGVEITEGSGPAEGKVLMVGRSSEPIPLSIYHASPTRWKTRRCVKAVTSVAFSNHSTDNDAASQASREGKCVDRFSLRLVRCR